MTIWKFPLRMADITISMPRGAQILCCQLQGKVPCLWAVVDPHTPPVERHFVMCGTGHNLGYALEDLRYQDTVQLFDGSLVLHIFEVSSAG